MHDAVQPLSTTTSARFVGSKAETTQGREQAGQRPGERGGQTPGAELRISSQLLTRWVRGRLQSSETCASVRTAGKRTGGPWLVAEILLGVLWFGKAEEADGLRVTHRGTLSRKGSVYVAEKERICRLWGLESTFFLRLKEHLENDYSRRTHLPPSIRNKKEITP